MRLKKRVSNLFLITIVWHSCLCTFNNLLSTLNPASPARGQKLFTDISTPSRIPPFPTQHSGPSLSLHFFQVTISLTNPLLPIDSKGLSYKKQEYNQPFQTYGQGTKTSGTDKVYHATKRHVRTHECRSGAHQKSHRNR